MTVKEQIEQQIQQLRAEIKILDQAAEIAAKMDGCGCEAVNQWSASKRKKKQLADLEAQAAAEAKADPQLDSEALNADLANLITLAMLNGINSPEARIVSHIHRLKAENKRLQVELARRPVVWCVALKSGYLAGTIAKDWNNMAMLLRLRDMLCNFAKVT